MLSEHPANGLQDTLKKELSGSGKSNAPKITPNNPDLPPELQEILNRWDGLPEHIKQAIMALVKGHVAK